MGPIKPETIDWYKKKKKIKSKLVVVNNLKQVPMLITSRIHWYLTKA